MDAVNKTDDYRYGKRLPNRPEYECFVRVTRSFLKDDAASAFVELNYTDGNYYDSAETIQMDNLLTVGLGLKYRLSEKAKITLGVKDLFDKSPDVNMFAVYNGPSRTMWYPLQGRTYYATLTWEF